MATFKEFQDYFLLCDQSIGEIIDWSKKTATQDTMIKKLLDRNEQLRAAIDNNTAEMPADSKFTLSQLREMLTDVRNQLSPRPRSPGLR
jgi:hypothetical protein